MLHYSLVCMIICSSDFMLIFFLDLYIESGESTRIIGSILCIVETLPPCIGVYNEICIIYIETFTWFVLILISLPLLLLLLKKENGNC